MIITYTYLKINFDLSGKFCMLQLCQDLRRKRHITCTLKNNLPLIDGY